MVTAEQRSQWKVELQTQIADWEKKLQVIIDEQKKATSPDKLAVLILQYEEIQREIADRSHVFSLLSEPLEALRNPYVKSEWYAYVEAAETISPEWVDHVVEYFSVAIHQAIESGEDDTVDLIQNEYAEYIFPGVILGGHADRIDALVQDMHMYIRKLQPRYDEKLSTTVVMRAFLKAIDSDVRLEPVAEAVKQGSVKTLTVDQRNELMDRLEERVAVLRFEAARKQNVAMEKALAQLEKKEK